ncbi:hypothetical protein [Lentilactobacillus hilgardii]|uniref:hypothetical protein n=1 Tax=Lentilactobacillus hilgardii TaxID=1588 RepID=UPI003FA52AEC
MKLVRAYQRVEVDDKSKNMVLKSYGKDGYNAIVEVQNPFSTASDKNISTITIHNLPESDKNIVEKGCNVRVYFGWISETGEYNTIGLLTQGTVSSVDPSAYASGDKTFVFTISDGSNYDSKKEVKVKTTSKTRVTASQKSLDEAITKYNSQLNAKRKKWRDDNPNANNKQVRAYNKKILNAKNAYAKAKRKSYLKQKEILEKDKKYKKTTKYKPLTFAKNTRGSTIIKKIAKAAGIKIYGMKLAYDHKFMKGYTAKSKPMAAIESIASICKTPVYRSHGKLYIRDYSKNKKSDLYISYDTGLLQEPELQDDSDDGLKHYQVEFLLRRTISGGTIYHLTSETISGWVVAESGEHDTSSDSMTTTCDCVSYSDYKKANAKKTEKAEKADKKAKAKLDADNKKKLKEKQKKRSDKKKK